MNKKMPPMPFNPAYCDYILWQGIDAWRDRNKDFVGQGVNDYMLTVPHGPEDYFDTPFWTGDDTFPQTEPDVPTSLTKQAETLIQLQPEARFFIRTWISPPISWARLHPDHIQTDEEGKSYRHASIASPLYLKSICLFLRNLVTYCVKQSWGDRVLGYLPAPFGEGLFPLAIAGKMFDCSPVCETAFRNWVRARYSSELLLRENWGDSQITFDTVSVPRDRQWYAKRSTSLATLGGKPVSAASLPSNSGQASVGLFHWIEPAIAACEHDYCRFQRDAFLHLYSSMASSLKQQAASYGRQTIVGFDIGKQPLMGWQILSAFDGSGDAALFPNVLFLSGSWDSGQLLDDPNIDVLFTPADYHARTVGFAYEAEGPADSMVLRGKTLMVEDDARTFVGAGIHNLGAFRTPQEVEAGLLRNISLPISRRFNSYWCNIGSSYFHDDQVQQTVAHMIPIINHSRGRVHRETQDAIAFVIDDTSPMYEDFTSGFQSLAVIWQRILGLAHCGVPYRIFLLSDLKRDNFPSYKVFFFPNLFRVNDEVMDLLNSRVLCNGQLAIFGPGTGITDGRYLSAEPASHLLRVPMELFPRTTARRVIVQGQPGLNHSIISELPAGLTYGDSLTYGPTLVPMDNALQSAGAYSLGWSNTCFFINRPGLFIQQIGKGAAGNGIPGPRDSGDTAMLWSCAIPLPANLLRAASRFAGCNIWSEEDDIIYASDSFLAVHTVKSGKRSIQLPRAMTVTDAHSGQLLGQQINKLPLELDAVQTQLFWLD